MPAQAFGQAHGSGIAQTASGEVGQADVDEPLQKGARGKKHRPGHVEFA